MWDTFEIEYLKNIIEIQISSEGSNAQLKDDNAKQHREAMIANNDDIEHTMTWHLYLLFVDWPWIL